MYSQSQTAVPVYPPQDPAYPPQHTIYPPPPGSNVNRFSHDAAPYNAPPSYVDPACTYQLGAAIEVGEQWPNRVVAFSSQYDNCGWAADKVLGPPRVYPKYGDHKNSWAQADCSSNEFIEIEYPRMAFVKTLDIYETYNAGAITRISLRHPNGSWVLVYSDHAKNITQSRIFKPQLVATDFPTNQVRIELDCTVAGSWCEIDAVLMNATTTHNHQTMLVNKFCRNEGQWACRVIAYSSQYNDSGWAASEIVGQPKVYPNYGDEHGAWAQGDCSSHEFIELQFPRKMFVESLAIYETFNAGAVTRIMLLHPSGSWVIVHESPARLIQHSRIFHPPITWTDFETNVVRLELDCTVAASWCEIDAVQLQGTLSHTTARSSQSPVADQTGGCEICTLL